MMQTTQVLLVCGILLAYSSIVSSRYEDKQCVPDRYNTTASRVERKINVHLIPHTHDDTGWLKTVDQYYYGARQDIQVAGVQYVLDTVIYALLANPDRKFAYAEMSFFTRWWEEQNSEMRDKVSMLVAEGRLSFMNGGWVQHDEAAAHYVAMIDQTTRGHRFLNETFGYRPRVGWQVDPFGHSSTHASLMSGYLGFDGLFFGRSDYQDLERRKKTQELEFLWRGAKSFGKGADIFTGSFSTGNYGPPGGFYFEWGNQDPPVQDNVCLTELNVEERVEAFVKAAQDMAEMYQDNDLFWPMGTDFTYSNAFTWYKNMDKLIHYVNLDGRVNAFYSAPAEYVSTKHSFNQSWPLKTDDFFPYADCPHCYWTGYFTSRAASKGFIRQATSYLQIARQLEFITSNEGHSDILEEAVALLQHHDAITGTEKQHVTNDYHKRLSKGFIHADRFVKKALAHMVYMPKPSAASWQEALATGHLPLDEPFRGSLRQEQQDDNPLLLLHQCPFLNVSVCEASLKYSRKAEPFLVVVYNSLAWPRQAPVRVPMAADSDQAWAVKDSDGHHIPSTWLNEGRDIADLQQTLFDYKALPSLKGAASSSLGFIADIPAMGYATYFVGPAPAGDAKKAIPLSAAKRWTVDGTSGLDDIAVDGRVVIGNDKMNLVLSANNGSLLSMRTRTGKEVGLDITGCFYRSSSEHGPDGGVPSGAYIFRPDGACQTPGQKNISWTDNSIVFQSEERILDSLAMTTRWWKQLDYVEIEWTAGPIDIADGIGKELVLQYRTNLSTGSTFYTDANGREMQKRVLNYRPTWDLKVTDPVSGNYYPLTAAIAVKDETAEMAVLVDRAQGGSSLASGNIEVMVHRRTLNDDSRGVAEPLNETISGCRFCDSPGLIVRGIHVLSLEAPEDSAAQRRNLQQLVNDPVLVAFGPVPLADTANHKINGRFSAIAESKGLPKNVQLLTTKVMEDGQILLRLAHLFEVGETSSSLAKAVEVDLNAIFSGIRFDTVQELGLAGAQALDLIEQLKWREGAPIHGGDSDQTIDFEKEPPLLCTFGCQHKELSFQLKPMEIRTFLVTPGTTPRSESLPSTV